MRKRIHSHITSLRLPIEWHVFIARFAERWDTTPAYVYRQAIREFIRQKQPSQE